MPKNNKKKSRIELLVSIAMQERHIKKSMSEFSKLFNEFSFEWLSGVESNYIEFLNYCLCSIKKHEENKKSK